MQFVPRALFALGAKATGENRAVATLRHEDMTGVENPFSDGCHSSKSRSHIPIFVAELYHFVNHKSHFFYAFWKHLET